MSNTTSLKSLILSATRRTKKGFTVGEIFDRVSSKLTNTVRYSTVRARVYELAQAGLLEATGVRNDSITGRAATVFVRN
jgi:hypothetical protein